MLISIRLSSRRYASRVHKAIQSSSFVKHYSVAALNINKRVPNADQYYPLNEPSIGVPYPKEYFPQNGNLPLLFQPLTIRNVTFNNRIWVSPMCQFSSDNGHATDWHLGFASRGVGAICMEATAVVPEGRISPEDAGLWTDSQIPPLKRIVNFAHAQGTKIGIQLTHAGRKASTLTPWVSYAAGSKTDVAHLNEGGWPDNVYAPSEIAYNEKYPKPKAMTEEYLLSVEDEFLKAVERCKEIGFDFIEIHGAHGYLIHQVLSPLSNVRTDKYGGPSLENRLRWPLRLTSRIRAAWSGPLIMRISATDWAEGPEQGENGEWKQWGVEQSKIFTGELKKIGVDMIDCSTGGNWSKQKIPIGPGYQVPFAEAIKKEHPDIAVGAVGLITDPVLAESYLKDRKADVLFLARELIRNPNWAFTAARTLGVALRPANEYLAGWM